MNELEELAHALLHQAEACYLTSVNHQRIHAYSMIAGLANLESRLMARKNKKATDKVEKAISLCMMCIKTTATTGKCYKCSKEELIKIEKDMREEANSRWKDVLKKEEKRDKK